MTFQPALFPILDYDANPTAFIEPSRLVKPLAGMPETLVLCFFQEVIAQVTAGVTPIYQLGSEIGHNPVFVLEQAGESFADC